MRAQVDRVREANRQAQEQGFYLSGSNAREAEGVAPGGDSSAGREETAGGGAGAGVAPGASIFRKPKPTRFIDFTEDGEPRPTTTNAGIAMEMLDIVCRKDTFHEKMLVGGHPIQAWAGDLSDDVVHMLRKVIKARFGFDAGEKNMRDAAIQLCLENQFNPVVDYLDGLVWDRVPRLGQWVVRYLAAPDTPLNREFGRLMLIAAVRRARHPGTKFDQIVVLEGREGTGKSSAIKILPAKKTSPTKTSCGK